MIGETTLAMLYVPLLFYVFDRLKEGRDKAGEPPPTPSRASGPAAPAAAHAPREDA